MRRSADRTNDHAMPFLKGERVGGLVVSGKVKAIEPEVRGLSLQLPDGKNVEIEIAAHGRDFAKLRVGDQVTVEFTEIAELWFVNLHPEDASLVERHRAGSPSERDDYNEYFHSARHASGADHSISWNDAIEVPVKVDAIDYETRLLQWRGSDGTAYKVKAGPAAQRFNEVRPGDWILARFREAASVRIVPPR